MEKAAGGKIVGRQGARVFEYDLVRVVACLMIVAMHAPMPSAEEHSPFLVGLSYLCAPGIPLFFMLSGALVLPVRQPLAPFLRRRLGRILWPLLVWTFLYLLVLQPVRGGAPLWQRLLSLPFSVQRHSTLWFLYTLAGLYLLAPLVSAGLERLTEHGLRLYLLLWGGTLLFPLLGQVLTVGSGETSGWYYLSGYAGYFILGYYLRRFGLPFPVWTAGVLAVLAACAPFLCFLAGWHVDFYRQFWYLSVFVAAMGIGWWALVTEGCRRLSPPAAVVRAVTGFSDLTFGIYLVHIYVLRSFLWRQGWIAGIAPDVLRTLVLVLLGSLLSALLCWALSRIPGAEYVIGYRRKKR